MLKGKGVFAVIAAILIVGLGITSYTSHYINKRSLTSQSPTMAGASMSEEKTAAVDSLAPESEETYARTAKDAGTPEAGAGGVSPHSLEEGPMTTAVPEETAPPAPGASAKEEIASGTAGELIAKGKETEETFLISPISGLPEAVMDEAAKETSISASEQKENYLKRLDELNAQIEKMWKDTEATSTAMKQTAEYELKMWDNELNKIYQEYRAILNEADAEALRQVELQWIKDRDAKALAASKQVSNGTLESLEYTRTLTESTKARTYELVEQYFAEGGTETP